MEEEEGEGRKALLELPWELPSSIIHAGSPGRLFCPQCLVFPHLKNVHNPDGPFRLPCVHFRARCLAILSPVQRSAPLGLHTAAF